MVWWGEWLVFLSSCMTSVLCYVSYSSMVSDKDDCKLDTNVQRITIVSCYGYFHLMFWSVCCGPQKIVDDCPVTERKYNILAFILKMFAFDLVVLHIDSCTKLENFLWFASYLFLKCTMSSAIPSFLNEASINRLQLFAKELLTPVGKELTSIVNTYRFLLCGVISAVMTWKVSSSLQHEQTGKQIADDFPVYVLLHCFLGLFIQSAIVVATKENFGNIKSDIWSGEKFDRAQLYVEMFFLAASVGLWAIAFGLAYNGYWEGNTLLLVLRVIVLCSLVALQLQLIHKKWRRLMHPQQESDSEKEDPNSSDTDKDDDCYIQGYYDPPRYEV